MDGRGLGIRVALAFVGALAASRAADGRWEPSLYAALIAAFTTAEAYARDPNLPRRAALKGSCASSLPHPSHSREREGVTRREGDE
jgi:hypothetical protein